MEVRFKFRTWDKENKKMIYDSQGTYDNRCRGLGSMDHTDFQELLDDCFNYATMQCTGRYDKNKKLIFEYDICKFEYCNNKYIGKIVFNYKTCAFEMWDNIIVGAYGEKATNQRLLCHCDNIEVIGNIFEEMIN